MKKNSFKRFLAVTLAAATALTFAPVSTLGLTGVVQAEAAALSDKGTATALDVKSAVDDSEYDTWDSKADATVTATDTINSGKGYFGVKITAGTDTTTYTVTTDGSSVSRFGDAESATVKGKDSFDINGKQSDSVVFKVAAKGKTTVKIVAHDTVDTTAKDKTLTINFVVNGPVTKAAGAPITIADAAGKTKNADITFAGAIAGDTYYLVSGNKDIFTVADSKGGNTTQAEKVAGKLDDDGSDEIVLKKVANGDNYLYVYANKATADKDAKDATDNKTANTYAGALAKIPVTVADSSLTVSAKDFDVDELGVLSLTAKDTTNDTLTFKFLDGETDVTDQFKLYVDKDGKAQDNPTTADNNPSIVYVKPSKAGTYTVEVTEKNGSTVVDTKKATFTVSTGEAPVVAKSNTINAAPQDNLIITDKTTYNLIENVTVKYKDVVYPASQLTWYLTNDLSDNNYKLGDEIKDLSLKTDANVSLGSDEGDLKAGKGVLTLSVNDAKKAWNKLSGEGYHIAATASINGRTTLVYFDAHEFKADYKTGKTQVVNATVSTSPSTKGLDNDSFLDGQRIYNPSQENYYLDKDHFNLGDDAVTNENNFAVTMTDKNADGYYVLKKSTIKGATADLASGVYYETVYQTYNTNNVIKLVVAVSVNAGPKGHISDGKYVYAATDGKYTDVNVDSTLYLDLKQNKTFSIPDHFTSDTANTTLKYDTNSANVTVDSKGVITAVSEGTCDVEVTPTANGIDGNPLYIHVQVNKYPFNTFTVTEEKNTNDKATVLNEKDFKNNLVKDEQQLVTKQIDYVEVFVTGNETQNVTETPVVTPASKANLTYSFYEKSYNDNGLTIDPKTGKITIDYSKIKNGVAELYGHNVYAVKVVADATNDAAQTTGYFYVVVDYPDQKISGIVTDQDYIVGTCAKDEKHATAVDLYSEESGKSASNFMAIKSNKDDDFVGDLHYDKDSIDSYETDLGSGKGSVIRAKAADKTMHVLAYNEQKAASHLGYTAEIASFKSAAADDNYVTKITNKETGEVLYDHSVNAGDTARELKIDKTTTIQVTLAHPVASVASGSAVHLSIGKVENDGHIYNQKPYVTGVVNSKEVDVALYPNSKGTSVIELGPTGHLTKTNRTDIHHNTVKVAVTYTGEASADAKNPAQVKGVKVSNKKGAKVTVTFNKITANSTMRYYVQKKIGKKVSGKSIGSTKTTLSVKKGATVKVRVKAYYYDANGVKHVGKYSSWKTLKTDKK